MRYRLAVFIMAVVLMLRPFSAFADDNPLTDSSAVGPTKTTVTDTTIYATFTPQPLAYAASFTPKIDPPPPRPTIYIDEDEEYCREYSQTIRVNGQMRETYGTACLQPDGSWRVAP